MYRTKFNHIGPARLQFQACSFYCRVWVNGKEIGDHRAGGYVAFTLDTDTSGENELFVLADNRFNHTTAPMHTGIEILSTPTADNSSAGGDFWAYGGIMRSVELHTLPSASTVWPWRAYVLPMSMETVNITVVLTDKSFSGTVDVSLAFDGGESKTYSSVAATKGQLVIDGVAVPNPKPWSPKSPNLHVVEVTINKASVKERFGLRQFAVDPATARMTLNGEIIKLHGYNHHTQWPGVGASPNQTDIDTDIALLLRGGTNYVRGAHYPQDPRWLDALDEAGIVMWCETLGPGVSSKNAQDWVRYTWR